MVRALLLIVALALFGGCSPARRIPTTHSASLSSQLREQDDSLVGRRFRSLLDFENDADRVFAKSDLPNSRAFGGHTGAWGIAYSGGQVRFRLSPILFSTRLPGDWTLLGCYVKPADSQSVGVALLKGETVIARNKFPVAGGVWTFVSLDLTARETEQALGGPAELSLRLESSPLGEMYVDDVLLVDNTTTLLDDRASGGWAITRRGYTTTLETPGKFKITTVAAAAQADGWFLSESSWARAVLLSEGPVKSWTLYPDGRSIRDGKIDTRGIDPVMVESHLTPGVLTVAEGGRVSRTTPGDADNDGYNERRGAYQIGADLGRVSCRIEPAGRPIMAPVLEISGLPEGVATAMVEGRLIERSARLPDGRVLITLPIRIERPTNISIRVTADNPR